MVAGMDESGRLKPWYRETPVIVLLLWFCLPVGLVLMWMEPTCSRRVKIVVTAVVVGFLFAAFIGGFVSAATEG